MGTMGNIVTIENGKNFNEKFDESGKISVGTVGAVGTIGITGTTGNTGTMGTLGTVENEKKTSTRTLMKVEKCLYELKEQ